MNKRGVMDFFQKIFLSKNIYDNPYIELNLHRVKDLMNEDVLFTHDQNKVIEAAHMMIGAHVSCLVVMDNAKLKGILTERDFIKKFDMAKEHDSDILVESLMTKKLTTIEPVTDLFTTHRIMKEHNFRKLIVVSNNELKGIITQTDLCKAVAMLQTPLLHPPLVKDVMTKSVLSVSSEDKFLKAKKLMASKDMGSVLVVDGKDIKGIFTEFDIVSEFFLNPNKLKNSYMKDLVTSPTICISPCFDMVFVNKLMIIKNFRRLPVIEGDRLVGMITQTDVAHSLYDWLEKNKERVLTPDEKKKPNHTAYEIVKKGNIILYKKKDVAAQKEVTNPVGKAVLKK